MVVDLLSSRLVVMLVKQFGVIYLLLHELCKLMSSLPIYLGSLIMFKECEAGSLMITLIMFKVCKVSCFSPSLVASRRFMFVYNCRFIRLSF